MNNDDKQRGKDEPKVTPLQKVMVVIIVLITIIIAIGLGILVYNGSY